MSELLYAKQSGLAPHSNSTFSPVGQVDYLKLPHIPLTTFDVDREVAWMQARSLNDASVPDGFPIPYVSPSILGPGTQNYGPFIVNRTVRDLEPYIASPGDEYRFSNPNVDSRHAVGDNLLDVAICCMDDIGAQFFVDWTIHAVSTGKMKLTPGKFWSGNLRRREGGLVWIIDRLNKYACMALSRAWVQKWTFRLARPEELFARRALPLTMVYPSPNHPSYVSGHAAVAGACAAVLALMMNDPTLESEAGAEVLALANFTFLGRWAAGIHWAKDGVDGLRLGWETVMYSNNSLPYPPSPW